MASRHRVLVLSAYHAQSHDYWAKALMKGLTEIDFTLLTLPPRHFAWRTRGNSLSWGLGDYPELDQDYDTILATSMVDICALRGFRPKLSRARLIVYFHENQFAYPASSAQYKDINIPLTSIYSALCADQVIFNSNFNRSTFLAGSEQLLKKMPDQVPKGILHHLESVSQVIPVPLQYEQTRALHYNSGEKIHLVWNHRWEHDKNPEVLFKALSRLKASNIPINCSIVGQSFRHSPRVFQEEYSKFQDIIQHFGFLDTDDYFSLLSEANVVISTAWHDFQGLSMQQAMAHGCIPIAPNRMAYPEYVPDELLYNCTPQEDQVPYEADQLAQKVISLFHRGFHLDINPIAEYCWPNLESQYSNLFNLHRL